MTPNSTVAPILTLVLAAVSACTLSQKVYHDPVPYCAAVGTIDHPNGQYVGPASPQWMIDAVVRALHLGPIGSDTVPPVVWRCAGGAVFACSRGLDMPCGEKSDTSHVPTLATLEFCRAFPDIDQSLPGFGGQLSKYAWGCRAGWPHIIGLRKGLDTEGYPTRYWIRVTPGASFSAELEFP
jgi:hypothetical protein